MLKVRGNIGLEEAIDWNYLNCFFQYLHNNYIILGEFFNHQIKGRFYNEKGRVKKKYYQHPLTCRLFMKVDNNITI